MKEPGKDPEDEFAEWGAEILAFALSMEQSGAPKPEIASLLLIVAIHLMSKELGSPEMAIFWAGALTDSRQESLEQKRREAMQSLDAKRREAMH